MLFLNKKLIIFFVSKLINSEQFVERTDMIFVQYKALFPPFVIYLTILRQTKAWKYEKIQTLFEKSFSWVR